MPAVIALILRQLIMAVATGAIVTGVQELLNGTVKTLVKELQDTEGLTEQEAKDVIANILVDLAVNSATIFTVLKTGAGVKAAEFLGLTSRGFTKKALIFPASSVAAKVAGPWEKFKAMSLMSKIVTVVLTGQAAIWTGNIFIQAIEPGIYKPREANNLWEKFTGIRPFPESEAALNPGPFSTSSSVTFPDFAKSLETAGVKGFNDPINRQSTLYSREGLAAIINYVYGQEVLKGNAPSVKQILPLIAPYLVGYTGAQTSSPVAAAFTLVPPITKVFTGIVSQGVVSQGLSFTPRPDDMIESLAELREAAANNLAPYLTALLGKIVYEVKIVSSVITKDGFKQTGMTQQIQTGTYANGQPRYKTVTNKFATLVVYALTDKGSRAKLTTIVLGPTNSAKLLVGQNDLRSLEAALPSEITTTDVGVLAGLAGSSGSATTPIATKAADPKKTKVFRNKSTDQFGVQDRSNDTFVLFSSRDEAFAYAGVRSYSSISADTFEKYMKQAEGGSGTVGSIQQNKPASASASDTAPVVTVPAGGAQKPGNTALTLFEWYQAQGQSLPSVAERAKIYASLGLGQESFYTGTAEQNTRLLNALKAN